MTRKHVVVIGGGVSGVAVAAAIARSKRARVTLIGGDGFGPGLAYGTKDSSHLLNVRASNMSARADKADEVALWLHSKTGAAPTAFASRGRYGAYAISALRQAQRAAMFSGGLKLLKGEAVSCRAGSGWWNVELASGRTIEASGVVLALGNQPTVGAGAVAGGGVPAQAAEGGGPALGADVAVMLGGPERKHLFISTSASHDPAKIHKHPSASFQVAEVDVPGAGIP